MFAGLTDREVAEAVAVEMRRRQLYGCIFMLPDKGGSAVLASSAPPGLLAGQSAAAQLAFFADVASLALGEKAAVIPEDTEDTKGWIN